MKRRGMQIIMQNCRFAHVTSVCSDIKFRVLLTAQNVIVQMFSDKWLINFKVCLHLGILL